MKLSVANGQYDLANEITADVNIKSLGDCNYAVQVKIYNILILFKLINYFISFVILKLLKHTTKIKKLSNQQLMPKTNLKSLLFVFVGWMVFSL